MENYITEKLEIPVSTRLTIPQVRKLYKITREFNTTKSGLLRELISDFIEKKFTELNINN